MKSSLFCLVVVGVLACLLVACGSSGDDAAKGAEQDKPVEETGPPEKKLTAAERKELGEKLHQAVRKSSEKRVTDLLAAGADPNFSDDARVGALHIAAELGREKIAALLITKGAKVNAPDKSLSTPLHWAAARNRKGVVTLLILNKAALDLRDKHGQTALHYAARNGLVSMAKLLLDNKAAVSAQDFGGWSPLHLAVAKGDLPMVELLLTYRADPNSFSSAKEIQPLHLAARDNHLAIVKALLAQKAEINGLDSLERSPLRNACLGGHRELAEFLVEAGADLKKVEFPYVAYCGSIVLVQQALADGADINSFDTNPKSEATALHWAAYANQKEMVAFLLEQGAKPDLKNKKDWTPLFWAAERGLPEVMTMLLEAKADVNAKTDSGVTALYRAMASNKPAAARILLEHKADPTVAQGSYSPIRWAVQNNSAELVQMLLDAGVDPAMPVGDRGDTALHHAASQGHDALLTLMLKKTPKPNVNVKNKNGRTPLHLAAKEGYPKAIAALAAAKADMNALDSQGDTPLHLLAGAHYKGMGGYPGSGPPGPDDPSYRAVVAGALLKGGADPAIKNEAGDTAATLAARIKDAELAELLSPDTSGD